MEINPSALYQFSRNGESYGPVPGNQLVGLVSSKQLLPGDHVWTDGMAEWVPAETFPVLRAAFEQLLPKPKAEPRQEALGSMTVPMQSTPVVESPIAAATSGAAIGNLDLASGPVEKRRGASFGWLMFLLVIQLVLLCLPALSLLTVSENENGVPQPLLQKLIDSDLANHSAAMIGIGVLVLLGLLLHTIVSLVYLHRAWKYVQDVPNVGLTPGKAVGFLLIPIFNVVWLFFAYYNWTGDYNLRKVLANQSDTPKVSEGLFLTFCIFSVVGLPILYPFVMFQMCRAINHLANSPVLSLPKNSGYSRS